MKNRTLIISFLVVSVLLSWFVFFNGSSIAQKTETRGKKKLFISTIKANGIPALTANRVKEGIRLAIFEEFGARYQVLDDDAIRVMYKQAEAIMASGCNETSCITQIADGINADEIVYGDVSRDGNKISISITDLERKGVSLGTKSIVKIAFLESQLDWFTSETAKKLMNPAYKIDPSKAPKTVEEIKIGGIEIKSVEKLDIAVIQFKTEDESLERIIAVLKKNLGEADAIYSGNNFVKARDRYDEIIKDIKERLRPEQQEKVKEFSEGIIKRIDTTWVMQYKPDIERVDAWIKEKKEPQEADMREALKKYRSIEENVLKIPYVNKGARDQLTGAINDRRDSIQAAVLSLYEKRGDTAYRDYRFDSSLENYQTGRKECQYLADTKKKSENEKRLSEKIKTTIKTGRGYMENRVKSLTDQAEYLYFDKQESDAKIAMKNAYNLLTGPMRTFATMASVNTYNKMAAVMKRDSLTKGSEPKLFAAIEEPWTPEEAEAHRLAMEEAKRQEALNLEKARLKEEEAKRLEAEAKRMKAYEKMKGKGYFVVKEIGGIKFVRIPGGSFMMGSPEGKGFSWERPQHKAKVGGFWMGMYEVTQSQYQDIMGRNPSWFDKDGYSLPVESVGWYASMEFCKKFSEKYNVKARLPYEAEWEYACRADSITEYCWGNEVDGEYCWYSKNSSDKTHRVGEKKPNLWGLYDMAGNVSEWCMDWYSESYYTNSTEGNPTGPIDPPSDKNHVSRGGYFNSIDYETKSAHRSGSSDIVGSNQGFRIVVTK